VRAERGERRPIPGDATCGHPGRVLKDSALGTIGTEFFFPSFIHSTFGKKKVLVGAICSVYSTFLSLVAECTQLGLNAVVLLVVVRPWTKLELLRFEPMIILQCDREATNSTTP
jgi:hypothetical protein